MNKYLIKKIDMPSCVMVGQMTWFGWGTATEEFLEVTYPNLNQTVLHDKKWFILS